MVTCHKDRCELAMLEEGADQSFGARFRLRIAIIARRDDDGRQRLLCNRRATICLIRLGAGQVFRGFVQLRNFAYSCTAQHCSQLIEQQIAIARVGLLGRHLSGRHLDRRRDFQCNEKRGAGGRGCGGLCSRTALGLTSNLNIAWTFTCLSLIFDPAPRQASKLSPLLSPRRRRPGGASHLASPMQELRSAIRAQPCRSCWS